MASLSGVIAIYLPLGRLHHVIIEKSAQIARSPEDVFGFVSDPRNDPLWCPKVKSVEKVGTEGEGPGSRFLVVHRPVPFRPVRKMDYRLLSWDPPREIVWREDDGHDLITVTYILERTDEGTRFFQRDEAELSAPKVLHPFVRLGIGADIAGQLKRLRRHLERS
jgi:uncharacterized protein YndB with AHSA1/START domain